MAHELSVQNNKAEMFYYGDRPWHGLGTAVDHALTASEAIEAAGLDWLVEKREIFFKSRDDSGEEKYEQAKGFATVRTDLNIPLGLVSDKYQPIQNHEAFNFIDTLVASREAKFHTAGALFDGEKVWILAKLPGHITVKGDDMVDKYLVLMNAHNGKSALRCFFSPIRVVCMNTLRQALASAETTVSIGHKGNIQHKVVEVPGGSSESPTTISSRSAASSRSSPAARSQTRNSGCIWTILCRKSAPGPKTYGRRSSAFIMRAQGPTLPVIPCGERIIQSLNGRTTPAPITSSSPTDTSIQ